MKNNIITALLFIFFISVNAFSQNNQTTINYSLSKSTGLENVGGDLVIVDGTLCIEKSNNFQKLFEATSHTTVFFDINNRGGGNSCVTLIVETASTTIRKVIPEDTQSGILKFNKVKNAYLTIANRPRDQTVQAATSIGTATVWF